MPLLYFSNLGDFLRTTLIDDFQNNLTNTYNNLKNKIKFAIKTKSEDKVTTTYGKVITTTAKVC